MAILLPQRPSPPQEDGLSRYARAARNNRLSAGAQHEYGYYLLLAGRAAEAVEWLQHAVNLAPEDPGFHTNLAAALHQTGQWGLAFAHAREALRIDPNHPLATQNVASFYYWFGETQEAADWYWKTIELDPSAWKPWWMWIFMRDFLPVTAAEALADRRKFNAAHQTPRKRYWRRHENTPDPEKRLRIGLTGGDFRQHSSSYMWGPMFEHLDRDRFMLFSYAHQGRTDNYTTFFQQGSNAWRDISQCVDGPDDPPGSADLMLAEQIRRDEIDVLVDMGTFSDNSHLMAHLYKPAPLSITAWGHLTGTGLDCMDGLLVDPIMVPPGREWEMTEQPVYVPHALGWYVAKHETVEIVPRPERPLTFGYLGRIQKLDDPTVALWADLLHAYPESRLILKDMAYEHERPRLRTLERFEAWRIDPKRIELRGPSGRVDHLTTYRDVDVALDPLPQGGGATTMEAFQMGVPTVTLRGERLVRRVSASTVTVAGHPEYVAENAAEYVEIAGRIVKDRGPQLRDEFLASHVCDGAARTRAFENAVRDLWRGWCREQVA